MVRIIIKQDDSNIMYHHTGTTKFSGCQCIKDCTCNEDFKEEEYDYYTVTRIGKKTTIHKTLEEANERWNFVCSLSMNKMQLFNRLLKEEGNKFLD